MRTNATTTITANGAVNITSATGTTLNSALLVTSAGNTNINGNITSAAGLLNVNASAGNVTVNGNINSTIGSPVALFAGGGTLTVDSISSGSASTFDFDAVGTINVNNVVNLTGGTLDLNSSGGDVNIVAAANLSLAGGTLNVTSGLTTTIASTTIDVGDLNINATGNATVNNLINTANNVTVTGSDVNLNGFNINGAANITATNNMGLTGNFTFLGGPSTFNATSALDVNGNLSIFANAASPLDVNFTTTGPAGGGNRIAVTVGTIDTQGGSFTGTVGGAGTGGIQITGGTIQTQNGAVNLSHTGTGNVNIDTTLDVSTGVITVSSTTGDINLNQNITLVGSLIDADVLGDGNINFNAATFNLSGGTVDARITGTGDIVIAGATTVNTANGGFTAITGTSGNITQNGILNAGTGAVVLTATGSGAVNSTSTVDGGNISITSAGDINLSGSLTVNGTSLTIDSEQDVVLSGNLDFFNAGITNVSIDALRDMNISNFFNNSGGGQVNFTAQTSGVSGVAINRLQFNNTNALSTNGGTVTLAVVGAGNLDMSGSGIITSGGNINISTAGTGNNTINSSLNAGSGSITLAAQDGDLTTSSVLDTNNNIIDLDILGSGNLFTNSTINTNGGNVTANIFGTGNIDLQAANNINTLNGNFSAITGTDGSVLSNGTLSVGTGAITLTATGNGNITSANTIDAGVINLTSPGTINLSSGFTSRGASVNIDSEEDVIIGGNVDFFNAGITNVSIDALRDMDINTFFNNSGGGQINFSAQASGASGVAANRLQFNSTNSFLTNGGTFNLSVLGAGDSSLQGSGIDTSGGNISITTAGTGNNLINASSLTSNAGTITLASQDGDLTIISALNTTGSLIDLDVLGAGNLFLSGTSVNSNGGAVAANIFGVGNIDVQAGSNINTLNGAFTAITGTDGSVATNGTFSAGTGLVTLTATGTGSINATNLIEGGNLAITAPGSITLSGGIRSNGTSVNIDSEQDVLIASTIDFFSTGIINVTIDALRDMDISTFFNNIGPGQVNFSAQASGASGIAANRLQFNANNTFSTNGGSLTLGVAGTGNLNVLGAGVNTGGGAINISTTGTGNNTISTTLFADTGTITLSSQDGDLNTSGTLDTNTGLIDLDVLGSGNIFTNGTISTNGGSITSNIFGTGNIDFQAASNINTANGGFSAITGTDGSILNNGTLNVGTGALTFTATGSGSITSASTIDAGDINLISPTDINLSTGFISRAGTVNIDSEQDVFIGGNVDFFNAGITNVTIDALRDMDINAFFNNTGAGQVNFSAQASGATGIAANRLQFNSTNNFLTNSGAFTLGVAGTGNLNVLGSGVDTGDGAIQINNTGTGNNTIAANLTAGSGLITLSTQDGDLNTSSTITSTSGVITLDILGSGNNTITGSINNSGGTLNTNVGGNGNIDFQVGSNVNTGGGSFLGSIIGTGDFLLNGTIDTGGGNVTLTNPSAASTNALIVGGSLTNTGDTTLTTDGSLNITGLLSTSGNLLNITSNQESLNINGNLDFLNSYDKCMTSGRS